MKTLITRTVASLALYDLGELGVPSVDLGPLGSAGDVGANVGGALDIANVATGVVPPIVQGVAPIPHQAASTGLGIVNAAIPGAGVPGLPFPLP